MYVPVAVASSSRASPSGSTNQPTLSPGAIVFENDELYAVVPPESSCSDAGASPSNRTSPYGSSSSTSRLCSAASSTTRRRRSSGSVRPLGFWNVGSTYRKAGGSPLPSAASSASG